MPRWTAFPYLGEYTFDADSVKAHWERLHAGDLEPVPHEAPLLAAWAHFHNGEFHKARTLGLKLGDSGLNVAHKATCVHATYLEKHEANRQALFLEVAESALLQLSRETGNLNAHYWYAYALSRYSQCISVAKALAQGLGTKVKTQLETVIRLQPDHADAHMALGNFHAEVIDKVGSLIGAMAYGAHRDTSLHLLTQARTLQPLSAAALVEYAHALLMLDGDAKMAEATRLLQQAAAITPFDATERLEVALACTELAD